LGGAKPGVFEDLADFLPEGMLAETSAPGRLSFRPGGFMLKFSAGLWVS
jgi:hypothetical protein